MIISSDSVQAVLQEKARRYSRDASQHLLCPSCQSRTRLYALSDGRRKCSACGRKFSRGKKTDATRLRQYADTLVCFALDFPAEASECRSKTVTSSGIQGDIMYSTESCQNFK
jgi:ribosomal protein L37AE/L43A